MRLFAVLAGLVACVTLSTAQQPQFKAPPGYTTKVEAVHKTYNFYGLTRTLALPWERLPMADSKLTAGNSSSPAFRSPSATATKLYNDPKGTLPEFGTPSRQAFQTYKGKDGDGCVLFFEYKNVLPANAKDQLSKLFFKTSAPPDPNESTKIEQFLVNDHTLIVWTFKNPKSKVKELHQEHIFNLVSEVATAAQHQKGK